MDVEVLPGPSLAERARTAIAQARLATVSWADPAARTADPAASPGERAARRVDPAASPGDRAARRADPSPGDRAAGGGQGPGNAAGAVPVGPPGARPLGGARHARPLLLLPPREAVTRALAGSRQVTATVPAPAPLGSLALAGAVEPREGPDGRVGERLGPRAPRRG